MQRPIRRPSWTGESGLAVMGSIGHDRAEHVGSPDSGQGCILARTAPVREHKSSRCM